MAGSPHYLHELATVKTMPLAPSDRSWAGLDYAWQQVTHRYIDAHTRILRLRHLAAVAFTLLATETDQPLETILQRAIALHRAKNAGYAGEGNPDPWANFRMAEAFGVSALDGCLVRMSDKYSRIHSLRENAANEQVGEAITDTLADLAAYALIAVCLINEEPSLLINIEVTA